MGQPVTLVTQRATGRRSQDAATQIERPPPPTLCKNIIDDNDNFISLKLPHYPVHVHSVVIPAYKTNGAFSPGTQIKVIKEECKIGIRCNFMFDQRGCRNF